MTVETAPRCPRCLRADAAQSVHSLFADPDDPDEAEETTRWQGARLDASQLARVRPPLPPRMLSRSLRDGTAEKRAFYWAAGLVTIPLALAAIVIMNLHIPGVSQGLHEVLTQGDPRELITVGSIALAVPMMIIAGPWLVIIERRRRVYKSRLESWRRVYEKWRAPFYCSRCHGVFVAGQRRLVPIEEAKTLLYEATEK